MALDEARDRIDECRQAEATSLDLRDMGLAVLPADVVDLVHLRTLAIDRNQLTELPSDIGRLVNLRTLAADDNQLTEIPDDIGKIVGLRGLYIGGNMLTGLPSSLARLTELETLYLGGNLFTSVPLAIAGLSGLRSLYLYRNELTELPSFVGDLTNLTTLAVDDNQLSALPDSIGHLANLETLALYRNQLTELPDFVGQLSRLRRLHLSGNALAVLPKSIGDLKRLDTLHLDGNRLTELPEQIGQLTDLQALTIEGNQLSWLPPALARTAISQVTINGRAAMSGLRLGSGNPFPEGLVEAATQGCDELWHYLEQTPPPPRPIPSQGPGSDEATSTADVVPGLEIARVLDDPTSVEGRDLAGAYERLIALVDHALGEGIWEADPLTERLVTTNRNALRDNVYESPDAVDLAVAGALSRNLARFLINAMLPTGMAQDLAAGLVDSDDPNSVQGQIYEPADQLASLGDLAGEVKGRNKFEWVADALGWTVNHPAAAVGGSFATLGATAAASLGVSGPASGVVGVVAALVASTLAYFGRQRRR